MPTKRKSHTKKNSVRNPTTGRLIFKDGVIAKDLKTKESKRQSCKGGLRNKATRRCVKSSSGKKKLKNCRSKKKLYNHHTNRCVGDATPTGIALFRGRYKEFKDKQDARRSKVQFGGSESKYGGSDNDSENGVSPPFFSRFTNPPYQDKADLSLLSDSPQFIPPQARSSQFVRRTPYTQSGGSAPKPPSFGGLPAGISGSPTGIFFDNMNEKQLDKIETKYTSNDITLESAITQTKDILYPFILSGDITKDHANVLLAERYTPPPSYSLKDPLTLPIKN
jgi:hypothetical protein